jgi:hypothetical protein
VGKKKEKVLFICKRRLSYGNSYGLINSATFVAEYLKTVGYNAKVEIATDANDIDKLVTEFDPKFVFLEAIWVTPEKMDEILSLKRHKDRQWIVRLHSRPTFIANEGIAFPWLLGYRNLDKKNLIIAPNHAEFAYDLKHSFFLRSAYLPNIYFPPYYSDVLDYNRKKRYLVKIGCFGSMRPMKNHLAQAMAAVKYAQENNLHLEFHMNASRCEQQGDQVVKNVRAFFAGLSDNYNLVEHDWLSHHDFVQLVNTLDIGMQVSLSETFNIVAADFVYNDITFVGSNQISWLPSRFQVIDTNSTEEMVQVLNYSTSMMGRWMKKSAKKGLAAYTENAKDIWLDFLK